jgi:hypothetical protein
LPRASTAGDRGKPGDVEAVRDPVQHVQEQPWLVVDRGAGSTGHRAGRLVDHRDLVHHLLVVEGDHELVVLLTVVGRDAPVGHALVDEGEAELLVVLVEQQPVVQRARRERQRDHVPAAAMADPPPRQLRQRPQVGVERPGDLDASLLAFHGVQTSVGRHDHSSGGV